MTIVHLLDPREHALRARVRALEALQRRVAAELWETRRLLGQVGRPPCGTEAGYQWHRYHDRGNWPLSKSDPCGCRAGHRDHARGVAAERIGEVAEAALAAAVASIGRRSA